MMNATIVWFRLDLRLRDNPALRAAVERGGPVVPVFIWSPEDEGAWAPGAASRWWLHRSLTVLEKDLGKAGARLVIRQGPAGETLAGLVKQTKAEAVYWSRRYEPALVRRDAGIKERLQQDGVETRSFNSALLFEPWKVETQQGDPYKVFTPFWKQCLKQEEPPEPLPAPRKVPSPTRWPRSEKLEALELEPAIDWAGGLREAWTPGEAGARAELNRFLDEAVHAYSQDRDRPDRAGTSRLSPHLHFGEISPRDVWHAVKAHAELGSVKGLVKGSDAYLRELGWREFAHHLLFHFPHTTDKPLREEFARFPWARKKASLRAWQKGRTGYPIVDAGLRHLWETGWMHNRVRMIVASFLVKDLLVPWQEGARWFWDTLVDADLASNTLGWQWTAGCGADAAPFFRIFNPILQGEKFDPEGAYVRRFVPELKELPARWLHKPWEAPVAVLEEAGVVLGKTYPAPVVDHAEARDKALAAYGEITGAGT